MEMLHGAESPPEVLVSLTKVDSYRRADLPRDFSHVWDFETWLIDTPKYMRFLTNICVEAGVKFRNRRCSLDSVTETGVVAVIDCTGSWSSDDFKVIDVRPVRGQAVLLPRTTLEFALCGDEFILASRSDGLMFGSLWEVDDSDVEIRVSDTRLLLSELEVWSHSPLLRNIDLKYRATDVQATLTGVRPYLENGEFVRIDGLHPDFGPIIHNIGHGGSGVALSWGAADEVCRLLAETVI